MSNKKHNNIIIIIVTFLTLGISGVMILVTFFLLRWKDLLTNKEANRGAGDCSVTAIPTGCGLDPHSRRWNIYLNLYFHFFALVSRQSAALSSATQHAMPPEFGWKWGTLGSLCLSCYVRNTAWSWFISKLAKKISQVKHTKISKIF